MSDRRHLANAVRALSMDAVQKANSGHPGMPMGMADIAEVVWRHHLNHNPANPKWFNRDRFVLSNGHGSMLLYSLLHLTGYDVSIEDLKNFRQLKSKTPGHPEWDYTPGVETTTGPLGQGLANAVGMALAEKVLAAQFNQPGLDIVDHHTYVFAGDGCLMEGVSHEVCSLAGTWQLGKLILFWDDNGISIDGKVVDWFTDDTPKRFEAYGWQVISEVDGHNGDAIEQAIQQAKADTARPTLICCKTHIGFGAPNKVDTAGAHGAPLGDDEIAAARKQLNWSHAPFFVPEEVKSAWDAREAGQQKENAWKAIWSEYQAKHPEQAAEFERRMQKKLPKNWEKMVSQSVADMAAQEGKVATRKASEQALNLLGPALPEFMGGSADLTGSNNTKWSGCKPILKDQYDGNYIYYGVREFGMCAIMNGLALHGGFIPYGGTFLVFSDYARNAIRMAALMKQRSIFVLTHDSIGLGEDGPTHQPIEHVSSLRLIPNLSVWRPADQMETLVAWQQALESESAPSALVLSRQNLPALARNEEQLNNIKRGGYILYQSEAEPELVLMATGSEVTLVMEAAQVLEKDGINVSVVSMPCVEAFLAQDEDYQVEVLPTELPCLVVEAGVADIWPSILPGVGAVMGLNRYGESAPGDTLFTHFGFTVENVVKLGKELTEV